MLREQISLGPDTATERSVARIVASLLGLKTLGVEENFFYLGGNSLFGTQLIARLREAFNVEVPLLKLFDHPTVADLSAEVERLMVTRLEAMTEEEAERLLALHTSQDSL
jgi:acyl carrier protein